MLAGEIRDHSRVTVELKKGELVFESVPLKKSTVKEETGTTDFAPDRHVCDRLTARVEKQELKWS